jgi:hypothetical protein
MLLSSSASDQRSDRSDTLLQNPLRHAEARSEDLIPGTARGVPLVAGWNQAIDAIRRWERLSVHFVGISVDIPELLDLDGRTECT